MLLEVPAQDRNFELDVVTSFMPNPLHKLQELVRDSGAHVAWRCSVSCLQTQALLVGLLIMDAHQSGHP